MFKNLTLRIKQFAYVVFWSGIFLLCMLLYKTYLGQELNYFFDFWGFAGSAVVGLIGVYFVSVLIYAFGELLEKKISIADSLAKIAENMDGENE